MAVGFLLLPRFCAEVEARALGLGDTPLAVHHRGKLRSLSPSAEACGLKPGMSLTRARAVCPEVEFIRFVEDRYQTDWQKVLNLCTTHVATVEPVELGEVFVDLTGGGQPAEVMTGLRQAVQRSTSFICHSGCGRSKLVARVAAQIRTGYAVTAEETAAFLAPLPLSLLWSLDDKTLNHLRALGLTTIGLLQCVPLGQLAEHFGGEARRLHDLSCGIDHSSVAALYPPRTITLRHSFPGGVSSCEVLDSCLRRLSGELAQGLRARQEVCHRASLRAEIEDQPATSRSLRLHAPTCEGSDLLRACRTLLTRLEIGAPVSALSVKVSELRRFTGVQLNLFSDTRSQPTGRDRAQEALTWVQERLGSRLAVLGAEIEPPRRERMLALLTEEGA